MIRKHWWRSGKVARRDGLARGSVLGQPGLRCVPVRGYPLAPATVARLKRRRSATSTILEGRSEPSVSVVLAAYNEEATIERRLRELLGLIAAIGGLRGRGDRRLRRVDGPDGGAGRCVGVPR